MDYDIPKIKHWEDPETRFPNNLLGTTATNAVCPVNPAIDLTERPGQWRKLHAENATPEQLGGMKEFLKHFNSKEYHAEIKHIHQQTHALIKEGMAFTSDAKNKMDEAIFRRVQGWDEVEIWDEVFVGWHPESDIGKVIYDYARSANLNDPSVYLKARIFASEEARKRFNLAIERQLAKCNPI